MAAPTVTTSDAIRIAKTRASGVGNITADGGEDVTAHGHCWALTADPDTGDSTTDYGARASSETGAFTSNITGLTANTLYHTRAYAINASGTSYGVDKTFTTKTAGYEYPVDTVTRVTGLIHRYKPGSYTLEMALGDVSTDFGMPIWSDVETSIPVAPPLPPLLVPPPPRPPFSPGERPPPPPGRPEPPGKAPPEFVFPAPLGVAPAGYIPGEARPPAPVPTLRDWLRDWAAQLPGFGVPEEAYRPTAKVTEVRPFIPPIPGWVEQAGPLPGRRPPPARGERYVPGAERFAITAAEQARRDAAQAAAIAAARARVAARAAEAGREAGRGRVGIWGPGITTKPGEYRPGEVI